MKTASKDLVIPTIATGVVHDTPTHHTVRVLLEGLLHRPAEARCTLQAIPMPARVPPAEIRYGRLPDNPGSPRAGETPPVALRPTATVLLDESLRRPNRNYHIARPELRPPR